MQQTVAPSPALIFDAFQGHQRTAALKAAIDFDLFTAIGDGANTTAAIASRCRASVRGVRVWNVRGGLAKSGGVAILAAADDGASGDRRQRLTPTSSAAA